MSTHAAGRKTGKIVNLFYTPAVPFDGRTRRQREHSNCALIAIYRLESNTQPSRFSINGIVRRNAPSMGAAKRPTVLAPMR
jgi:hypothetical protein